MPGDRAARFRTALATMPTALIRRASLALMLATVAHAGPPAVSAPIAAPSRPVLKLHVPSPDWRDQVIYFVMTDRFADSDPSNNDQHAGEFAAGQPSRYNGGDLRGLTQRLDYIAGLGATALWITPPVANQWIDPSDSYTGFHGYWAEHFKKVDRHLGTLADYKQLSSSLHGRGMFLVQDIVVNHTGNYFSFGKTWNAADPAASFEPHQRTPPVARPTQPPFDRNDPRDPAQRAQAIYHWTPDVTDYANPQQVMNFQMAGLDDLNTENPAVRRALRDSYGYWIREVGVDAFRVDTAFYVPPAYFADFLHARDAAAPGIADVARRTGRRQFHVFGEGFGVDKPFQEDASRKIERYMSGANGEALLPGMLNFPLYGALGDVFARGQPTAELGHRIKAMMTVHARPHLMPSFVDNHDVDRFLAGGSVAALRQALLAMFMLPGIPVIYYGTEQGFTEQRGAMFAAGFGSGGRDRYDTSAPLYRTIADLSALRRGDRVFTRGTPSVLRDNAAQAGALAWRMDHGKAAAFVVFNTAGSETLLDNLETGLPAGTQLQGVYGLDGRPPDTVVGAGGRVTLLLPPRSGLVWKAGAQRGMLASASAATLTIDPLPGERLGGDFTASGTAPAGTPLQLVVDGDLARARGVVAGGDGRWQAEVDTSHMIDADVPHSLIAWAGGQAASPPRRFRVERQWALAVDVEDPAGDDRGPSGRYTYPTDASWGPLRQMDLRRVRAFTSGGALRLELTLHGLSRSWSPANGFDHVAFTIFIELPDQTGGATVMPLQDGSLPSGMRWHRRLRAGGWSNALFEAQDASAASEGRPLTPGASIQADAAARTVTFTLPAAALGSLPTLSGARIYVTTWDHDGGYRPLAPVATPFGMGGAAAGEPKVMDDALIRLP